MSNERRVKYTLKDEPTTKSVMQLLAELDGMPAPSINMGKVQVVTLGTISGSVADLLRDLPVKEREPYHYIFGHQIQYEQGTTDQFMDVIYFVKKHLLYSPGTTLVIDDLWDVFIHHLPDSALTDRLFRIGLKKILAPFAEFKYRAVAGWSQRKSVVINVKIGIQSQLKHTR
jgi:hypothetical protein